MAKANPFFDVDMSKFADVSKLMSEFKLPGINVESVPGLQQKNIQALTARPTSSRSKASRPSSAASRKSSVRPWSRPGP